MASYKIGWKKSAAKDLKTLPPAVVAEIVARVTALAEDPFPSGVKKLTGAEHTYRIRFSSYRVIYTVFKNDLLIEIVRVGHRQSVYKH
jgi:mRNA interferase RelE/StbE